MSTASVKNVAWPVYSLATNSPAEGAWDINLKYQTETTEKNKNKFRKLLARKQSSRGSDWETMSEQSFKFDLIDAIARFNPSSLSREQLPALSRPPCVTEGKIFTKTLLIYTITVRCISTYKLNATFNHVWRSVLVHIVGLWVKVR